MLFFSQPFEEAPDTAETAGINGIAGRNAIFLEARFLFYCNFWYP